MAFDEELEETFARSKPSLMLLRRIGRFARPYRRLITVPLCIELVWVVLSVVPLHFVKMAVDQCIPEKDLRGVFALAGVMLWINVSHAALSLVQRRNVWRASQLTLNDLRKNLFHHIQGLSMDFFDREKLGRIMSRIDRDVEYLEGIVAWIPMLVVNAAFSMVAVTAVLMWYDWRLCGIVVALAPLVAAVAFASKRWALPTYRRVRLAVSRMTANLAENITGIQVVQAFAREESNLSRFQALLEDLRSNQLAGAFVRGITMPSMLLVFGLARAGIIEYGGHGLEHGYVKVGEIIAATMYVGMVYGPITMIANLYDDLLAASAAAERIVQLMDRKPTVRDGPGATEIPAIVGHVRFDHVYLKYDDEPDAPWILEDITFEAKPGEIVALVGPTGAGKSSIVNLIPRFYQPQAGAVLVDGHDIRTVTQQSLHWQMGVVLQENFLFSGTVMDNLKYGRPETTDDQAVAAAKALGSHEVIMRLAKGYETDVRERGGAISHGERQLICFTRALIANPRILVLDEATSAVDTQTEAIIQRALWKLMEGRTTFVVAHRLSTVRHADKILVVQGGRLVEWGTHNELLRLEKTYAAMFAEFIREV